MLVNVANNRLLMMRNKIKHIAFSLFPLLLFMVVVEGILRLAGMGEPFSATLGMWDAPLEIQLPDQYSGFRLKPNARIGSIALNSLGYRDDELNQAASIKILCLGDSVAFGWGVHDPRDTYAGQLERVLAEKLAPSHRTVEVFNAGIPSYPLYQGVQLYLHHLAPLGPWDYVICSYAWNQDLDANIKSAQQDLEFARRNPPGENTVLKTMRKGAEQLRSYNVLESLYVRAFLSKEINNSQYPYVRYEALLEDLAKLVKNHNSRLILLAAQVREEDKGNNHGKPMLQLNAIAKRVAQRENVPYVDTDQDFRQKGSGWYDNVHFDEKGHLITAKALSVVLSKELGL